MFTKATNYIESLIKTYINDCTIRVYPDRDSQSPVFMVGINGLIITQAMNTGKENMLFGFQL